MEKCVALHFTRSMYVYENQNTNLLSQSNKNKGTCNRNNSKNVSQKKIM